MSGHGGVLQALDEMRPEEATEVLLNHVPAASLDEVDQADARRWVGALATRLGEWPLLLGIFGGALNSEITSRGRSLPDAVTWLQDGLDAVGLTAFDRRRSEDRNQVLSRSVEVSLQPFSPAERERLYELTVFAPGEAIPGAVAIRLWMSTGGIAPFVGERLLREFSGTFFSLDSRADPRGNALSLRFHDALREHLGSQLAPGRARELHRLLLASYIPAGAAAATMPDDGYLSDHLAYHLQAEDRRAVRARRRSGVVPGEAQAARCDHRTNYGKSPTTTQRSTSPMSLTTDRHPTRGLR